MAYDTIAIEVHGAVRRILLARPAQRNAQSQQMLDELMHAMDAARVDDAVNVVVIGGQGDHFSAGHDLKQAQAEQPPRLLSEQQLWYAIGAGTALLAFVIGRLSAGGRNKRRSEWV